MNTNHLLNYIKVAPLPLASERALEVALISNHNFENPTLDLGCGDGLFASFLAQNPIETGLDPNASELKRAALLKKHRELLCNYGHNIEKPDGYYKTVLSNSVLEHIENLSPVLSEVHRVLSDRGTFYVTLPLDTFEEASVLSRVLNFFNLQELKKSYHRFYNSFWKHYHCYNEETWKNMFKRHGFEIIESKTYNPFSLATFHDFMVPFSLFSFFSRKYLGRWFVFPKLRAIISPLIFKVFWPFIQKLKNSKEKNTLIFLKLMKRA